MQEKLEKNVLVIFAYLFEAEVSPIICKKFENTRKIYSNSERSEQFVKKDTF
jgi:hypothetical protein